MRNQGSEAHSLDCAERGQLGRDARRQGYAGPTLEVVEGAGLDAQARRGVSAGFRAKVRLAAVAFATLMVLGFARVSLYTATLGTLQVNESMRTQIRSARSTENDLKVTTAMLSSDSRIARIASQNYGMTLSGQMSSNLGTNAEHSTSTSTSGSTEAGATESDVESYDEASYDETYESSYDESDEVADGSLEMG